MRDFDIYAQLVGPSEADWRQAEESEKQRVEFERAQAAAQKSASKGNSMQLVNSSAGGDFANPTPGTVNAVCTRVIDRGTQETNFGPKRQLMISFEIDEQRNDGKRFMVNTVCTASIHPKSRLGGLLAGWRGKPFADGEEFDPKVLLGKPALLKLVENGDYGNIASMSKLPKGMSAMDPEGDLVHFDMAEPDWDAFATLSENLQATLNKAPEIGGSKEKPATQSAPVAAGDFDDDIPF